MAKKVSTKKPLTVNSRSKALNATKRMQKPNLQKVRLDNGETIRMSARELRSLKKTSKEVAEA